MTVDDPYRWLESADNIDVQRWIGDEDRLTRRVLDRLPVRSAVKEQLGKLLYSGNLDSPKRGGTRYFFTQRLPHQERSVLYVREAQGAARVLVDPNLWPSSEARAFQAFWPSGNGRKLAFATSKNNADREMLQVLDVDSGAISDEIDGIYEASLSWNSTGTGYYYRWSPPDKAADLPNLPAYTEVRLHTLGTPFSTDERIRGATGDAHVTDYVAASPDGHWLLLREQRGFTRQDVLVLDRRTPTPTWTPISAHDDVWSEVVEADDALYLKTTEGALRGTVFRVDPRRPARPEWRQIVPERPDATLVKMRVVASHIILLWRKDDISELQTCALDGTGCRTLPLPGVGYLSQLQGAPNDRSAFVSFESYTVPAEILEIDPTQPAPTVWQRMASPIDPDAYVTEEKFYSSRDGARIPIFIVHRRDVQPAGAAPTVYWGYGGFGIPVTLEFEPDIFAWLDRGGVYAEVGIRGGGDYGEAWHRAGMRTHKQTVIDDYIAGAEALFEWRWTRPEALMACGGSNGGLLVGAAITQRPDLFRAAFIRAPLLDMVRYPLFGNGKQWTEEYGSPDDPAELRSLLSYSPYHNVRKGVHYPSVLVYSPDSDDRVDPMHARKFVAALQAATTGGPVLLSVAKAGGHFGPAGVEAAVDEYADLYSFGLHAMGFDAAP